MTYDENIFKEKANRKARKIWIVFAVLLSANYGSDASGGLYPTTSYLIFLALCWLPLIIGEVLLRVKGWATELYRYDLVIGYGIFYTFVICTTASPIAFTYILPVTSLLVLYKNRKFMINCGIANALIIVGAAVYRYMLGFNSASDMKNYQLQLSCIILCYICYVMSIRHLNESDGAMTDSIRADLHRVVTTVEQVKSSSNIILDGITVVRELASENKHGLHQNLRILSRDQYVLIDSKGQSHKVLLPGQLLQRNVLRPLSDPAKIFLFRFRCHRLFPVHQQIITIRTAYRFQQKSRIQCGFFDSRCL